MIPQILAISFQLRDLLTSTNPPRFLTALYSKKRSRGCFEIVGWVLVFCPRSSLKATNLSRKAFRWCSSAMADGDLDEMPWLESACLPACFWLSAFASHQSPFSFSLARSCCWLTILAFFLPPSAHALSADEPTLPCGNDPQLYFYRLNSSSHLNFVFSNYSQLLHLSFYSEIWVRETPARCAKAFQDEPHLQTVPRQVTRTQRTRNSTRFHTRLYL